jgi:hypothetical protein
MKKTLLFFIVLLTLTGPVLGQTHTQSLSFDDLGLGGGTATSGTYNQNDTFSFDVYLTYSGYSSFGLSLWLETQTLNNFPASLFITGLTYGTTFTDPEATTPNPAPFDTPQFNPAGYLGETRDLGATAPGEGTSFLPVAPGTYLVGHVSFAIVGAMPGTYTLRTTTTLPRKSEATDTKYMDNFIPAEVYTITIVPEPTTVTLLGLGALGLAATLRAKKRAR